PPQGPEMTDDNKPPVQLQQPAPQAAAHPSPAPPVLPAAPAHAEMPALEGDENAYRGADDATTDIHLPPADNEWRMGSEAADEAQVQPALFDSRSLPPPPMTAEEADAASST